MKPITIIGGGLAGLSLGLCLRRFNLPVAIYEAGDYPLKKVCGEFLSGLPGRVVQKLGIEALLERFPKAREAAFFVGEKKRFLLKFPSPVYLAPRAELDTQLAILYRDWGGTLYTHSSCRLDSPPGEGIVVAWGKKKIAGDWIGLKAHLQGIKLRYDLEMYANGHGYLGLCRSGRETVNLCGFFKKKKISASTRKDLLAGYLLESNFSLAYRYFEKSQFLEESFAAIPSFRLGFHREKEPFVRIGDSFATVPPFVGNGMAMAMESGAVASEDLLLYAQGKLSWLKTVSSVHRKLRRRFFRRLYLGLWIHPLLMKENSPLLPLLSQEKVATTLYRLTRSNA